MISKRSTQKTKNTPSPNQIQEKMTPDPTTSRPVEDTDTFEGHATLSYERIACLLREGSGRISACYCNVAPNQFDILCGRDKEAHGHFGNKSFRETISIHCDRYQNTSNRGEKTRIIENIIALIRECRGRFLKKDEETNLWYEVSNKYVHEKVSHALRSAKSPQQRKCRRTKKAKGKSQHPTAEEVHILQTLHTRQQHILSSLFEEQH